MQSPKSKIDNQDATLLRVTNLTKVFNPGAHAEVKAVTGINFTLDKGEIVLIMGPSGSGKTTLLTMLGGLLKPSTGKITFDTQELQNFNHGQLTKVRREQFGFIFQSFNLLENLCAWENVYIAGFRVQNRKQKAVELLRRLGLGHRLHQKPKDLSGGERQRVAIARALINDPQIIFADEPTANLDRAIGHEVMQLLCSIGCEQEKGIIIVSHDERIKDVAHRVLYIEDGQLKKEEKGRHNETCAMPKHHHKPNS